MTHVGEDVEQGEHPSTAGESANLYRQYGKVWPFLRKMGINLPQALERWRQEGQMFKFILGYTGLILRLI